MADLVESLTTYSRVSTAEALVEMRSPIERALSIFPVLQSKGRYELTVEVPADTPPVRANLNSLQQVLVNLLKNAKDALDESGGGKLSVRVEHDEDAQQLRVRVEDTGPGIPPEVKERLFQPFFTTKQEGVGLGLYYVHSLAEAIGAELTLEDREFGGAVARITLPVAPATPGGETPEPVIIPAPDWRPQHGRLHHPS